ncbi:MAG: hypothetical protein AAB547_01330 [Patescibacteria group bacterium]
MRNRKKDILFVVAGFFLGVLFEWNIVEIAIFSVLIWSIIGPIRSRYLAWPALFFLSFTPILLAVGRKAQAEEFAIYAYYFLVMAVIRGIIEVRGEKEGENDEKGL